MRRFLHPITWILTASLMFMPLVSVQAAMVGTHTLLDTVQLQQSRANLQHLLDQQSAQEQLRAHGVSPDQLRERIASLTDSELVRINQGIEQLNTGGEGVISVLLLIFIIFVITDVIGATDVFPFIHSINK